MRASPFALLLAASALPAAAPTAPPEAAVRIVRYADLDVARPADARVLRRRIARAIEAVCGSYDGSGRIGDEEEADRIAQCRAQVRTHVELSLASHRVRLASSR